MDYRLRQTRLLNLLEAGRLDALLIRKKQNISYLTGIKGDDATLFISHDKNILLTDPRYEEEYAESISHCQLNICGANTLYAHIGTISKETHSRCVGFEADNFSYSEIIGLRRRLKGVSFRPVKRMIEGLRMVKDRDEIRCIKEACRSGSDTMNHAIKMAKPFTSEEAIKNNIESYIAMKGLKKADFDIIVASGKNSSMPHVLSSKDKTKKGRMVIIDLGTMSFGYNSDLTRTVFLGRIDRKYRHIYTVVLDAQKKAIECIKPGVKAKYIDNIARQYIEDMGMGKYFIHSLGHGIGLETHESPHISKNSDCIIEKNMTITIEPGVYIAGWGGVRIEDVIRITEGGFEILTKDAKRILCN